MVEHAMSEDRRLIAAVAAALLASQGSPVWARTAELLLLSSRETRWHYERASRELDDILRADAPHREAT